MLADMKKKIFSSCGQWKEEEKQLGRAVCDLISSHDKFSAYFAENQSSLEAFTAHILKTLDECFGFIGIMHRRGEIQTPDRGTVHRASVWIEQELSVVAYMSQVLQRQMQIHLFIQNGIVREGIREKLLINATNFENGDEVIQAIPSLLGKWSPVVVGKVTSALALRLIQAKEAGEHVTVRGDEPKGRNRLVGNRRWQGERECIILDCDDFTVVVQPIGSGVMKPIPLSWITPSKDMMQGGRLMLLVADQD
jgi:hypothetical protein